MFFFTSPLPKNLPRMGHIFLKVVNSQRASSRGHGDGYTVPNNVITVVFVKS